MNYKQPQIVLASGSPRRRQMLDLLKVTYSICKSDYEEDNQLQISPEEIVELHAKNKVKDVAEKVSSGIIIGADTLVSLGDKIYGKPQDYDEACKMLLELQGTKHNVYTGIAIYDRDRQQILSGHEVTSVKMRSLNREEINHYFDLINPFDKAGAYAIQDAGSLIIERIEGCYYNVLGFPIVRIDKLLRQIGYSLFKTPKS